jgi:hypothetical protein
MPLTFRLSGTAGVRTHEPLGRSSGTTGIPSVETRLPREPPTVTTACVQLFT